uniref:Ig-like domain-containing protein n=1 Tax=Monopterus albus TaxID=43700 RepID=A0A3Q3K3Y5_MONAL
MAVWDKLIPWIIMFFLGGAAGQYVNYPGPVCAVRRSTVTLPCNFTSPKPSLQIIRVVWCQNHEICQGTTPSVYDSENQNNDPRYQYLGDKKGNCTLQIRDVRMKDSTTFRFRMEANDSSGHFTGQSGVKVTVDTDPTEMQITSSTGETAVTKGQTVKLHCTARCTFHQLEVAWFRDDNALSETGPALQLRNLMAKDSGNYTCALKTNINRRSQLYSLHVENGAGPDPSRVSVTVVAGASVAVLLALCVLVLVIFVITRKRAAAGPRAGGDEVEQKRPDAIYSNILMPAKQELRHGQETEQAVEDVSYASVQFTHKNQPRAAVEAEDAIVYSTVASRS